MTAPGLPPMNMQEAHDYYQKVKGLGFGVVAMADPAEIHLHLLHALSALVVLGDHMVQQSELVLAQQETVDDLSTALRKYVDQHLEAQMAATPDEQMIQEAEEQLTGVAWVGSSKAYWDNFAAINHDLAVEVLKMAEQAEARGQAMKIHPSAIDADSTESGPSEG